MIPQSKLTTGREPLTELQPHATPVISNFKATLESPRGNSKPPLGLLRRKPKVRLDFLAGRALGLAFRSMEVRFSGRTPFFLVPGFNTLLSRIDQRQLRTVTYCDSYRTRNAQISKAKEALAGVVGGTGGGGGGGVNGLTLSASN